MAKNETTMYKDPKASVTGGQKSSLPLSVVDKMKGKSSLPQSVVDKMKGKRNLETMKTRIGTVANKYRSPIGPSNKGSVPGGAGIPGLNNVRLRPTAKAPKATVSAKAPKATTINIPGNGLPTGGKTMSSTPAASKATSSSGGLGVTTGKTTGSSATRAGTGGRTTNGGRAAGGGYSNAGPAGMGASGRGTGGKR